MIEIFAVKLFQKDEFLKKKDELLKVLPAYLQIKLMKFSHNDNLQRTILGELLVRNFFFIKFGYKFSDLVFNTKIKGKPFLKDSPVKFNISHSGQWVVAAFSSFEVGVDIELIKEPNYNVAKRFFSDSEINQLKNSKSAESKKELFFDLWTIKESYLKAIGTGLTKPLNTFTVNVNKNKICLSDDEHIYKVFIKQYEFDKEYKLSVCGFEKEFNNKIFVIENSELFVNVNKSNSII